MRKRALAFLTAFLMGVTTFGSSIPFQVQAAEPVQAQELESEDLLLKQDGKSGDVFYNASGTMTDFRDETIYFLMTTRFYDGDPSNNVQCWDAQDKNPGDPPWRGDFKGLIEKLDYIKALGFTAIWITPVVENCSGYDYHGYHAINFSKVDPRYESKDCTYQDLIDAAHEKGIKIIQDVVFNHTGNWGEENLYKIAEKDYSKDLSDAEASMVPTGLPAGYESMKPQQQYETRVAVLTNAENDKNNIYHHNNFIKSWETYDEQVTHIAGDCLDLNTENPAVYHYLVQAYSSYIKMGVDAFRVDTVKHINRLVYNNALVEPLNQAYNETHGTTGANNFYMFGEVCTRVRDVWNRGIPAISCPFYTWKESEAYAWDDSETEAAIATNQASVQQAYAAHTSLGDEPTSDNAFLKGNEYHTPDYSKFSGLNVIDFPMHWSFKYAKNAFDVAVGGDQFYNDATFNVTYVDSHDYAPDGAPEDKRYSESQEQWAENLSLMFTFRGIPCIYYGSEIEFKKGMEIDKGPTKALEETGRAYFGDHIEGSVETVGFGRYKGATGAMAESLAYPLSQHIQRLNRLRAAIPALRKGQYSTEGCSGGMSFKRRYTDADTDSFALVTVSGDATFSGIPDGTYIDAITGDTQTVSGGTLSTSGCTGQGNLRVYVLSTSKTPAPGMIDGKSQYLSGGTDAFDFSMAVDRVVGGEKVEATSVKLDKTEVSLDLGESVKLTPSFTPENTTAKTLKWSSSDTEVAKVSGGTVSAGNKEGTATITATTSNGLTATVKVTVAAKGVKVTGVTLNKSSLKLDQGKTEQLTATVSPADADAKYKTISWRSSDDSVAKVDQDGLVSAIREGTATITAITASGVSATATVKVKGTGVNLHKNAVYFEKPAGWGSKVNAYMWEGQTPALGQWPGTAMTLLDEANGVYGIEWPAGKESASLKVIFNDGSSQTADLTAEMNALYDGSGKVVKTIDPNAVESGEDEDPVIPEITASKASGEITGETKITFTLKDAESGSYQINGGEAQEISGSKADVTVGKGMKKGEKVTITVNAVSSTMDQTTKTFEYTFNGEGGQDITEQATTQEQKTEQQTTQEQENPTTEQQTVQNPTTEQQAVQNPTTEQQSGQNPADEKDKAPVILASQESGAITGQTTVTYTVSNAKEAYYCQDQGQEQKISGDTVALTFGAEMKQGDVVTVMIRAIGQDDREYTKSWQYTFVGGTAIEEQDASIRVSLSDPNAVYVYNGRKQEPEVVVKDGSVTLAEGRDYTVSYLNNMNACEKDAAGDQVPTVVLTGIGAYSNAITAAHNLKFTIEPKQLQDENVTVVADNYVYNGDAFTPAVFVTDQDGIQEKDYYVFYESNTNAGTAKAIVVGKSNYKGIIEKSFEIAKAERPQGIQESMTVAAELGTLSGVSLPQGWSWDASAAGTVIQKGESFTANAVYDGADKENYKVLTAQVVITGVDCTHDDITKIETRNERTATCTVDGYSGDQYCTQCQMLIKKGQVVPAAGHQWRNEYSVDTPATCTVQGTKSIHCSICDEVKAGSQTTIDALGHIGGVATCNSQAVCDRCHEKYGQLDNTKHAHTTTIHILASSCLSEGYTGDICCSDCGRTLVFGSTTDRLEHTWDAGVVTLQATADRDGAKTYTCLVCGTTRTETLPKTGNASTQQQTELTTQQQMVPQPATEAPTTAQPVTTQAATTETSADTEDSEDDLLCERDIVELTIPGGQPAQGAAVTDSAADTSYKVTSASAKTVEFTKANRTEETIVVPDTLVINGVSYQVTSIAAGAFKGQKAVESIEVGENVKTIGSNAFSGCTHLEEITLPSATTSIGSKAFYKCTKLKAITIPAKVNQIGSKAFYGCKNLKKIYIRTTKLLKKNVGTGAFKGIASKAVIRVPKKKLTTYKKMIKSKGAGSKVTYKKL